MITLILASIPDGAPAVTRNRRVGRELTCSETVHRAPFVHATDALASARVPVASVETTQVELTVARTANRPSAVWAAAGAPEAASDAKAMHSMKVGVSMRVIATRLRPSR